MRDWGSRNRDACFVFWTAGGEGSGGFYRQEAPSGVIGPGKLRTWGGFLFLTLVVILPFFYARRFSVHFFEELPGFFGCSDDSGAEENHQLDVVRGFVLFLK